MSYRNPALLSNMAKTLDYIVGGRFILGIGAGWSQRDYDEFGYEFGTAGDRLKNLERGLEVMRRGDSVFQIDLYRSDSALRVACELGPGVDSDQIGVELPVEESHELPQGLREALAQEREFAEHAVQVAGILQPREVVGRVRRVIERADGFRGSFRVAACRLLGTVDDSVVHGAAPLGRHHATLRWRDTVRGETSSSSAISCRE
jgi:hypothetical protein